MECGALGGQKRLITRGKYAFSIKCACLRAMRSRVPWSPSTHRIVNMLFPALKRKGNILILQPWDFFGRNDAKAETPVLWPPHAKSWLIGKDWCWEGLGAEGEGDDRGWDGWMASLTQWMWVWVNSGSWWWTGRPGVLRFMGSQRVGHNWPTELNWTEDVWAFERKKSWI